MTATIDSSTSRPSGLLLSDARRAARLTQNEAAELCGLHRTTHARQEAGKSRVSLAAYRLLLAVAGFSPVSEAWAGWRLDVDGIWTPEAVFFSLGEIRALPVLHALISELQRETGRNGSQERPNVAPLPLPRRAIR